MCFNDVGAVVSFDRKIFLFLLSYVCKKPRENHVFVLKNKLFSFTSDLHEFQSRFALIIKTESAWVFVLVPPIFLSFVRHLYRSFFLICSSSSSFFFIYLFFFISFFLFFLFFLLLLLLLFFFFFFFFLLNSHYCFLPLPTMINHSLFFV